jgi:exodeoxyribonuclease VII large subunit
MIPLVPPGVKVLSVSELTQEIKGLVEDGFASVWVSGEVSNFSRASSGHLYLTLKDNGAQMKAVIWRSAAMRLRFDPHDGLEVLARGRVSVYPPRGEYQFVIEAVQPKGLGALELAFRQLREKLSRLGYFAPERKKRLPRFPSRIALVTSPGGAAIRDMLEILGRRWPAAEVWVCPVRVQGDGAAQEVVAAIGLLNRVRVVDLIIVGRGGGSAEDLWAFNEECVAHAIYRSRIPVVSAVGHEIDVTIADLVADRRALTPSEAAELAAPDRLELLQGIRQWDGQLRASLWQQLEDARGRLLDLAQRRAFCLPLERIRDLERRIEDWGDRLQRVIGQSVSRSRDQLKARAAQLESLSPLNVLGRGYSLTRRETDQVVVRSPEQVQPGDRLVTYIQQGRIVSRVEEGVRVDPAAPSVRQG